MAVRSKGPHVERDEEDEKAVRESKPLRELPWSQLNKQNNVKITSQNEETLVM